MKCLNDRYDYGLDLFLLSIDEGITGYRDDSLEVRSPPIPPLSRAHRRTSSALSSRSRAEPLPLYVTLFTRLSSGISSSTIFLSRF